MKYPPRVAARVILNSTTDENGCWISNYSRGSHGYAQIGWTEGGRRIVTVAHRVAFELANGPIPDGLTVDHICRVRPCVNPDHMRLLSNIDNARDNGQARKTHCPHGHEYDEDNTYQGPTGGRRCRTCARLRRLAA